MLDTLNIVKFGPSVSELSQTNFEFELKEKDRTSGEVITEKGHLKNLRITRTHERLSIQGSLSQYLFGSNFTTLNRNQVIDAIGLLEDRLDISLSDAEVRRVDFAENLKVTLKVNSYYPLLGDKPLFIRHQSGNSLYYSNGSRKNVFYDKPKEMRATGDLSLEFNDENWMRFEARFTRYIEQICKSFGFDRLTVSEIIRSDVFGHIIRLWGTEYFTIHKINTPHFDLSNLRTPSELTKQLAIIGLKGLGGELAVLNMIESSRAHYAKIYRELPSKLKKIVREISVKQSLMVENIALVELETLVKDAIQNNIELSS